MSREQRGPSLDLEWEVLAFRGLRGLLRGLARRPKDDAPDHAARLAGSERKLGILAQVVAEAPVTVRASAGAGGVVGATLYLPREIAIAPSAEQNARLYVARTLLAAAIYARGAPREVPVGALERALLEIELADRAYAWLIDELPGCGASLREASRLVLEVRPAPDSLEREARAIEAARRAALVRWAGVDPVARAASRAERRTSPPVVLFGEASCPDPALDVPATPDERRAPERGASEVDAPAVENVELVHLDQKEIEDAVLVHSFEKVDTADEYQGGGRNLDGADELGDHGEALDEVKLGKVVRSADEVHAVLRADVGLGVGVGDVDSVMPGERGVPYDEWDARAGRYREGFCTVYPSTFTASDPSWASAALGRNRRLVRDLTRAIEAKRRRLEAERARPDGEEIDLDAMVRHLSARAAFEAGSPRLYVRKAQKRRDVATTVLLDVSLSSDAWIDDRRVLDVTREAALVLGEVAEALGDPLELLCFASHTRNHCRVWELRGARTPWPVARARLGALVPRGYTRIGPAIRHATASLAKHPARDRLLLLLGDAKPTDFDRYEGRHGVADVRQAVREADRLGVRVHALTVDRATRLDLPAMVGPGRWHLLRRVDDLSRVLVETYAGLTG